METLDLDCWRPWTFKIFVLDPWRLLTMKTFPLQLTLLTVVTSLSVRTEVRWTTLNTWRLLLESSTVWTLCDTVKTLAGTHDFWTVLQSVRLVTSSLGFFVLKKRWIPAINTSGGTQWRSSSTPCLSARGPWRRTSGRMPLESWNNRQHSFQRYHDGTFPCRQIRDIWIKDPTLFDGIGPCFGYK
jgi:hypothetical protein